MGNNNYEQKKTSNKERITIHEDLDVWYNIYTYVEMSISSIHPLHCTFFTWYVFDLSLFQVQV